MFNYTQWPRRPLGGRVSSTVAFSGMVTENSMGPIYQPTKYFANWKQTSVYLVKYAEPIDWKTSIQNIFDCDLFYCTWKLSRIYGWNNQDTHSPCSYLAKPWIHQSLADFPVKKTMIRPFDFFVSMKKNRTNSKSGKWFETPKHGYTLIIVSCAEVDILSRVFFLQPASLNRYSYKFQFYYDNIPPIIIPC